jgi:hypothetical protein
MPPQVAKFAPLLVVVAIAGYWLWPHLAGEKPRGAAKPSTASAEFTAAMLTPKLPPPPRRDPFLPANAQVAHGKTGRNDVKAAGGKAPTAEKKLRVGKAEGLVLNATCIVGDQRLAIIDGRMYAAQETLAGKGTAAAPYKIVSVLPHKVLLEHEGNALELTYSDAAVGSAYSASGADRGKPAGGGAKKSRGAPSGKSGGSKRSSKAGK